MATTALTPSERAERAEARLARKRAEAKAARLRLIEGGTFAGTAFGIGAMEARFPQLQNIAGGRVTLPMLATVGGIALLAFGKGTTQEIGSGIMYGGAGPLLHGLGARVFGGA